MGLFSSTKRNEDAEKWSALARGEREKERTAGRKADEHSRRLTSGQSQDRECDRYLLRQAEEDRRLAEANARDFEANAQSSRRWW